MLDRILKAAVVDSAKERVAGGDPERGRSCGWRRFLRPPVLGCFGLALAIVLWGYGYRLSQYHTQRDMASRSLAPKLWVDQRNPAGATTARLAAETQGHESSNAADLGPLRSFNLICVCALVAMPPRIRRARRSKSLLPLRSPPSGFFSA